MKPDTESDLDAILLGVQNSGVDFAANVRSNPSFALAKAKAAIQQKLDSQAVKYATKLSVLDQEITGLKAQLKTEVVQLEARLIEARLAEIIKVSNIPLNELVLYLEQRIADLQAQAKEKP